MGFFTQKEVCAHCGKELGAARLETEAGVLCVKCFKLFCKGMLNTNDNAEDHSELMAQGILAGLPNIIKNSMSFNNTSTITINGKTVKGKMGEDLSREINEIIEEALGGKSDNQEEVKEISYNCDNCGAPKESNALFCGYCGSRLK